MARSPAGRWTRLSPVVTADCRESVDRPTTTDADERFLARPGDEVPYALRSVVQYSLDDPDPVSLRDDVRARYSAGEAAGVIEALRERPGIRAVRDTIDPENHLRCEAFVREGHVRFHFPTGEASGVVAADDEAVGKLREFADARRRLVDGTRPADGS